MSSRFRQALALVAILSVGIANGAHVAALQGFAWVRMFSEFRQVMPEAEALALTFSGQELCGICVAVDGIQADMDQTLATFLRSDTIPLILLAAPDGSAIPPPPSAFDYTPHPERFLCGIAPPVETPPPRC